MTSGVNCHCLLMWLCLLFHSETYGEEYVEIEIGKKETRDGDSATMPISRFIKLYGDGDLYMVHNLPESMKGLLKSCCLTSALSLVWFWWYLPRELIWHKALNLNKSDNSWWLF